MLVFQRISDNVLYGIETDKLREELSISNEQKIRLYFLIKKGSVGAVYLQYKRELKVRRVLI